MPNPSHYREGWVVRHIIRGNFVALHSAAVSSAAFRAVGGFSTDRDVIGSEDWQLWTKLAVFHPFVRVPEVTAETHVHGGRTSIDLNVLERCYLAALRELYEDPVVGPRLEPYRRVAWFNGYLFVALACYRANEQRRARSWLGRAVGAWPAGVVDRRVGATFLKSFVGRGTIDFIRRQLRLPQV